MDGYRLAGNYDSKICEKKPIVLTLSKQMCYYNAIERPNSVAPVKGSRKNWLNLQSTVEVRSEPRSFLPGLIMMDGS